MNNIYLIGYRGAGKSTIAPMLADRCGWTVVEMDDLIQQEEQCTIAEIFARDGEAGFRNLETQMLRKVAGREKQVVSTGGGIILREENRQLMRATGTVVWLKASAKTIALRLSQDESNHKTQRPALTSLPMSDEIAQLLKERSAHYAATSDFSVDTETHKLNEIVGIILSHMNRV